MSVHARRHRDLVARAALLVAGIGASSNAWADVASWTGTAGDRYWQTANNWSTHAVPGLGTDVTFSTGITAGSTIAIGSTGGQYADVLPVNSLTLNTTTSFTLGNTFCYLGTTTGNLTRSTTSGGTQSLVTAIDLYGTNAFTWNIGGSGSLVLTGQILRDNYNYPSANFTKSGAGTLVLRAAPYDLAYDGYLEDLTWAGTLNVNAGTVELDGGSGFQSKSSVKPAVINVGSSTYITARGSQPLGAVNISGNGVNQGILGNTGAIAVYTDAANTGEPQITTLTAFGDSSIYIGQGASLGASGIATASNVTLTKFGPGELDLGGSPTSFSGTLKITDGSLLLFSAGALGNAASVQISAGATLLPDFGSNRPLTVAGTGSVADNFSGAIHLAFPAASATYSGKVTLAGATSVGVDAASSLTFSGQVTDNGAGYALTKVGLGKMAITGTTTVTAPINVTAGTLALGSTSTGFPVIVQPGATLELANIGPFGRDVTVSGTGVAGVGGIYLTGGGTYSGTTTLTGDTAIGVVNGLFSLLTGPIAGPAYNLTKVGPGSLQLTNAANAFKSVTVSAGSLVVTSDAGIPAAAPVTVAPGADLELSSATFSRGITVTGTGLTTLGAIRNTSGNSTLSGNIYVPGAATIGVDLAGGTLALTGNITGAGGVLTKVGPGKLVLSGTAFYQTLLATAGVTSIAADNASAGNLIIVSPGATLEFPYAIEADGPIAVAGAGVNNAGAIHTTGAGSTYFAGPIQLTGNATVVTDAGSTPFTDAGISDGNAGFSLTKSGLGTLYLAGNDAISGGLNVAQGTAVAYADVCIASPGAPVSISPGAKLVLAGTGAYASRTYSNNGGSIGADAGVTATLTGCTINGGYLRGPGTFVLGAGTSLFNVSPLPGSRISVTSPVALANFTSAAAISVGAATTWDGGYNQGAGNVTVKSGGSLAVNSFENDGVISVLAGGSMTNDVSNLVSSGGSQILIGSKAAPGGTLALLNGTTLEVNGGLLANNGAIAGTVNVNYGGLAKGSGVYGTVNVNDGGRFSPGNSPGAVTTGNTTWGSGGGYLVEVTDAAGAPGTGYDQWNINGNLAVTAGNTTNTRFVVSLASLSTPTSSGPANNFNPSTIYSWQIAHVTGAITGFDPGVFGIDTSAFQNSLVGTSFTVTHVGANIYLSNAPASLTIPVGSTTAQGKIVIPTLTVSGKAILDAGGANASELGTLAMPNDGAGHYAGSVDLMDSDLVVHGTPEATIGNMIRAWYNNGARNGNGLGSSFAAQPGPDSLVTLGLLTDADGRGGALYPAFDGISLFADDVLVKYTYLGDTDLNGLVDGNDLANLFAGMNGGLHGWVNGDANYDGTVDGADLTLLGAALRDQGAPLGSGPGGSAAGGAVPEPASAGLLLSAGAVMGLRRRR